MERSPAVGKPRRICSVPGCCRKHYAQGFCKRDYDRTQRGKAADVDPRDPATRYEALVDRSAGPDGCHPWTGTQDEHGYGRFSLNGNQSSLAHRFGFQLHVGPLAGPHVHVRHTCDNPPCQNPQHWLSGSAGDNAADMVERGRQQHGVRHYAAKLTEDDVRAIREAWATRDGRGLGRVLATHYNVTPMVISRIVNGKSWRSVAS